MPVGPNFRPETPFADLGPEFSDPVQPAAFPQQIERWFNLPHAKKVGLDALTHEERVAAFVRFEPLPGAQSERLAVRYHGHQFRTYNPEIGDGRGFLYAQMREAGSERLLDFGTKGSGRTPWSRFGDGRLTLKSGVREVLAAEMLETLGVPTSKAFSLFETGESLVRGDEPSPTRSAVLTRLSWSHVRFGAFQRLAYFDRPDLLTRLTDHVVETYYPELADAPDRPVAMFSAIVARSAELVARWTAAGFVHGVLNTDNMSVTGESFDYGPWRFLPYSDPGFTAAYFDTAGLYAFGRQAPAVFWNLQQLAGALTPIAEAEPLVDVINGFGPLFQAALRRAVCSRLGVREIDEARDARLTEATFALLAAGAPDLRWEPLFHDWRGGPTAEARALGGPRAQVYRTEAGAVFRDAIAPYQTAEGVRISESDEPEEMLIDEVEAIWSAVADRDDWSPLHAKLERLAAARGQIARDVWRPRRDSNARPSV